MILATAWPAMVILAAAMPFVAISASSDGDIRGILDLSERALHGPVLSDQLADAVGDTDQDDGSGHEPDPRGP